MLFSQYNGTSYELNAINNLSSFQFFTLSLVLSKLDPLTQKSILDKITSLEKLINKIVIYDLEILVESYLRQIFKEINLNPSLNIDLESSFRIPMNIDFSVFL
jgi:hypothetical protein